MSSHTKKTNQKRTKLKYFSLTFSLSTNPPPHLSYLLLLRKSSDNGTNMYRRVTRDSLHMIGDLECQLSRGRENESEKWSLESEQLVKKRKRKKERERKRKEIEKTKREKKRRDERERENKIREREKKKKREKVREESVYRSFFTNRRRVCVCGDDAVENGNSKTHCLPRPYIYTFTNTKTHTNTHFHIHTQHQSTFSSLSPFSLFPSLSSHRHTHTHTLTCFSSGNNIRSISSVLTRECEFHHTFLNGGRSLEPTLRNALQKKWRQ